MLGSQMKTIEVPAAAGSQYADRTVKVMYDDKEVNIVWLCGGSYRWSRESMLRALVNFESLGEVPEILYKDLDDKRIAYIVKLLEDNSFAGDDELRFQRAMQVPWDEFHAALKTACGVTEGKTPKARAKRKKL